MPVVSIFKMMAKFCQFKTRIDKYFTNPDFKVTVSKGWDVPTSVGSTRGDYSCCLRQSCFTLGLSEQQRSSAFKNSVFTLFGHISDFSQNGQQYLFSWLGPNTPSAHFVLMFCWHSRVFVGVFGSFLDKPSALNPFPSCHICWVSVLWLSWFLFFAPSKLNFQHDVPSCASLSAALKNNFRSSASGCHHFCFYFWINCVRDTLDLSKGGLQSVSYSLEEAGKEMSAL